MRFLAIAGLSLILSVANVGPAHAQEDLDFVYGSSQGYTGLLVLNGNEVIQASAQGWCSETGVTTVFCNGRIPTNNYIVGECCGRTDHRNWFSFAVPLDYGPITSAALRLNTAVVSDPPNLVTYYDILDQAALGTGNWLSYVDQGSGTVYGSRVYSAADAGMVRDVQLNAAAIAAIFASQGTAWALGGDMDANDVIVAPVPEPGSMILLATGLIGVFAATRRRQRGTGL